jgi:heme-degrading monooxygenase HmoA
MTDTNSKGYVAINYITCKPDYRDRFEELFKTRKKAIDEFPGFRNMHVLKPTQDGDTYLIVSHWDSDESFREWTKSEAFLEGHKRGFEDIAIARKKGLEAPMRSEFKTYQILTR